MAEYERADVYVGIDSGACGASDVVAAMILVWNGPN
jgi:hypothetical protein